MVLSFRHAHHPVKRHKSLVCPRFPCQYFWMRFPKSLVQSWGHGDAIKPLKTYVNMSNRMTSRNIDKTWQNLVIDQTMQGRWKCLVISTYCTCKKTKVKKVERPSPNFLNIFEWFCRHSLQRQTSWSFHTKWLYWRDSTLRAAKFCACLSATQGSVSTIWYVSCTTELFSELRAGDGCIWLFHRFYTLFDTKRAMHNARYKGFPSVHKITMTMDDIHVGHT